MKSLSALQYVLCIIGMIVIQRLELLHSYAQRGLVFRFRAPRAQRASSLPERDSRDIGVDGRSGDFQ